MSAIGSVGGAGSAWPDPAASRAAMKERMFAKVDADGSGSVDKTELQGLLEHLQVRGGQAVGSADELLTKMDGDGNGSLGSDELDAGMKSLMPAPSSTVEFAQQRAGGMPPPGGGGPPPPPGGSDAADSSASTDPLDTNADGVVSEQERLAGALQDILRALDTDSDGSVSATETKSFLEQLGATSVDTTA